MFYKFSFLFSLVLILAYSKGTKMQFRTRGRCGANEAWVSLIAVDVLRQMYLLTVMIYKMADFLLGGVR